MIKTFKNKNLADLWESGRTKGIDKRMHKRILDRLQVLDVASVPEDLRVPGFNFHSLNGFEPTRYTIHVNGPWCITFEFEAGEALRVDFEQYH